MTLQSDLTAVCNLAALVHARTYMGEQRPIWYGGVKWRMTDGGFYMYALNTNRTYRIYGGGNLIFFKPRVINIYGVPINLIEN